MIDVRQLIPLEIQLQEYVSLFLYKLKTVNWIPSLILVSGFLFSPESKSDTWLDPTWKQMLDNGSLQDGEPHLRATARKAVARVTAETHEMLRNVPEVTLTPTDNGICDTALASSTYNGTFRAAVSFDGEATEARLRRRTANWIGRVELREA